MFNHLPVLHDELSYLPRRKALELLTGIIDWNCCKKVKVYCFSHCIFVSGNLMEYFYRKMGQGCFPFSLNLSSQRLWHVIPQQWYNFLTFQLNTNPLLSGNNSGKDALRIQDWKKLLTTVPIPCQCLCWRLRARYYFI